MKRSLIMFGVLYLIFSAWGQAGAEDLDQPYTARIKEFTTEKFFLTELVDHLPKAKGVPTPLDYLGHIAGAPDILDYSREIHGYMRALAKASPRVQVFSMGPTDQGKEMILVAVSGEANMARLGDIRGNLKKLADPRKLDASQAEKLIVNGIPAYWLTGGLHSRENGSPEMLMELAYRIAVGESDWIKAIRDNTVVLITPILEVDGWDRAVDAYRYSKAQKGKKLIHLAFWGNYVMHDNNRDNIGMGLQLSRNVLNTYMQWYPQVMHDLHESIPFLYISAGTGPYNAWLDPIIINEWEEMAAIEVTELTRRGVPGVWAHGFWDGWAPGYIEYAAIFHNSLGRFYETFGGIGADTQVRPSGDQAKRAWYRPSPPFDTIRWSFRNNINLQQSGVLVALKQVADNRQKYLRQFFLKSQRSVAKPRNEGPAAYVITADGKRPLAAANLVNLLFSHGVEIHRLEKEAEIGGDKFSAGSYVIRMDQPYSRCADMLLDIQYYNPKDPKPYDDTGWTLGPLFNVKTTRVTSDKILEQPMNQLSAAVKLTGSLKNTVGTNVFVINHRAENELFSLRYALKGIRMRVAEKGFSQDEQRFNAGSLLIPLKGNPADLLQRLEKALQKFGLAAVGLAAMPDVASHEVDCPRIAIAHSWTYTQDDGWFRLAFEQLQIPYAYISLQAIRDNPNLREQYDCIILPPSLIVGNAQRLVNGITAGYPIPWQKTAATPNLGSPDSSDDIRGGLELQGVMNLHRFVSAGGLFIPIASSCQLPIDYGFVESLAISKPKDLQATGVILNSTISDAFSPVVYGYERDKPLGVYFNRGPVIETGIAASMGMTSDDMREMGDVAGKPSGRGTPRDPDVAQGRVAKVDIKGGGTGMEGDIKEAFDMYLPRDLRSIRVLLRFDAANKLLVSGLLENGDDLANKAAVIDAPLGAGHIVFFAINPMWRLETQGSIPLLLNAVLNYRNLQAGSAKPAAGK